MYFATLPQQIWNTSLLAAAGVAFWRGGKLERRAAIACVAASVLNPLLQNTGDWLAPQWWVMVADMTLFVVLAFLAVTSRRIWPLFAAAFALVGLLIHAVILVDDQVRPLAYLRGLVIFSYLVLVALVVGSLTTPAEARSWPARRRRGPEEGTHR